MSAVVLTSETPEATAQFYARRMDLNAPEPAEATVESEQVETPAKAEGESIAQQEQAPNPERKQKLHIRFSELSEQHKAELAEVEAKAKAEVEAERAARVLAEQQAAELRTRHEPPKEDPLGPEPKRAQFVNDDEFAEALKEWTTEKVTRDTVEKTRVAGIAKTWQERQAAAKAELPDYEAVIGAASEIKVRGDVEQAIYESEQGPWILRHLAQNPSLAAQLWEQSPEARMRTFGKLEGKFEAERLKAAPAKVEAKTDAKPATAAAAEVSRAPAPINPLKGGSAVAESPIDEKGEYHGTFDEWKAARKAGKIK